MSKLFCAFSILESFVFSSLEMKYYIQTVDGEAN